MNIRRIIKLSMLIVLLLVLCLFFVPRTYDVLPFQKREGTEYWELSTGSKIGYTKILGTTKKKKSPIIYLHGGPGGLIRDEIIEVLKPLSELGHDLYFYDQIGSGHSERLNDISQYTVKRHQTDLHEIINKIGNEKVILIGHSWGCLLAINYLQDYPKNVERIIMEGPGPILPINRKLSGEIPPDSLNLIEPEFTNADGNKEAQNLRSKIMAKWAFMFESKLASDNEADQFFTYLNEQLSKSTVCKAEHFSKQYAGGGGGYYSHIFTVKSFDEVENKRDRLREMEVPALIIRGQCDNQKWGYAREYLDLLQNSKLVILDGVGHDLIHGNKDEYFNVVYDFISHTGE